MTDSPRTVDAATLSHLQSWQGRSETVADEIGTELEADGGSVKKREYWGLRGLAYRIKKNRKGHYVLLNLNAPANAVVAQVAFGLVAVSLLASLAHRYRGRFGAVARDALIWCGIGVALVGVGSGLYLTCNLGPGPRDGWMTGIHHRTGWPVARVRLAIEAVVLASGWLIGGTVGLGTLLFGTLVRRARAR